MSNYKYNLSSTEKSSNDGKKENKTMSNVMTREQKIKLCNIYNSSDCDCFEFIRPFCNDEQLELLDRLVTLNNETAIGWGREPYTDEELEEYYNGKWQLLNYFGLENIGGDAYFEGQQY